MERREEKTPGPFSYKSASNITTRPCKAKIGKPHICPEGVYEVVGASKVL